MMNFEKQLEDMIEEHEKIILGLKAQLHRHREGQQKLGDTSLRFYDWRPLHAAQTILAEHGGKMKRDEMVKIMVAGGMTVGKKRDTYNIHIGLDLVINNGKLKQKGDWISLP